MELGTRFHPVEDLFGRRCCLQGAVLTRQQDSGFAADQQAVAVLGGAVVLAHVALAALLAFLEAADEQRAVGQNLDPGAGGHGHAVPPPGHHDGLVALDPAVQQEGALSNGDHIAGLLEEGELRRPAATWRREGHGEGQTLWANQQARP